MKAQTAKLYSWATQKATSSRSPLWIGLLFALELVLFLPLDAVLMFFCLQNPRKTLLYVLVASGASVISGTCGYLLGHLLWDMIGDFVIPHLISMATFAKMASQLQTNENWAIFLSSLLPFPLKLVSLTAGVFHLEFLPFITALSIARLFRFALVGGAMLIGGERVRSFVDRHFHRLLLLVGAKVAAGFVFFWALAR